MKYIALIYYDPAAAPQSGSKMNEEYFAFTRRAMEAGVMKGGDALHPPATATVVRTRHANFFLLDSLKETMVTQGTIGEKQRAWLATALSPNAPHRACLCASRA